MSRYTQAEREVLKNIADRPYEDMYRVQDTCEVVLSLFSGSKFAHCTEEDSLGVATKMVKLARMEEFMPFLRRIPVASDSDCWMCYFDPSSDPPGFELAKSRFLDELVGR